MTNSNGIQNKIIQELGLEGLPEEKQKELIIKMTEAVMKRILLETMEKLHEEEKEKYAELIGNGATPEEIDFFLRDRISGYDQFIEKIIADFKEEMKSV